MSFVNSDGIPSILTSAVAAPSRRDAINAELNALAPQPIPDLDQAQQILEDFSLFWQNEQDPNAKRRFLSLIFQGVWIDEHRIVAVQPKPSFLPFFQTGKHRSRGDHAGVNDGSDGTPTRVCRLGDRD